MRTRPMGGITFAHPPAFWTGFLACVAGVALHLPMYIGSAGMDYHMRGMAMDAPMVTGMALIVVGLALTTYGLLPRGLAASRREGAARIRAAHDAPFRPAHIGLVLVMTTAVTIDAMKPITLSFVAPGMGKEYGLKSALNPGGHWPVALLPLFGLTGTVLGSFLWGWLGDHIGRRSSILLAGVMFVTTAVCGAMPSFWWNLAMCLMMGLAAGGMLPITFSLLAEMIPGRHRGWVMVLIGGNLALAYSITSSLSSALVPHYSWRILWLLGMPTGVLLIALNRWIPESPRFLLAHGREDEARAIMARYGAVEAPAADPDTDAAEERREAAHGAGFTPLFRPPFAGLSIAVVVLGLGIGLVTYGFQLWIPSNLQKLGLAQKTADAALRDSSLLGLPLVFVAAAMYGLWSAKKTIIMLTALVAAALVAFSVSGEHLAHDRAWLYVLLAGPIVGTATIAAVLAAYSSEIYPTRIRSRGSGLSAGVGKLGGVAVTVVLVAGATVPSINTTALLGAVPLLLAVLVVAVFGVDTKRTAGAAEGTAVQPADA
ncbi:MFS transporter [Actinomadura luteofluorescens]|uniref:MFS transporter n=1 Tax=Actinomadura luteofluorescens TaxID=46163 RepID=UPI00216405B3|nr:MFS transporter [Actinomadura glauciflava]MCR3740445.1 MFS transporter, putative metabolite:H+ symporter [Actinomadura glauciflava]